MTDPLDALAEAGGLPVFETGTVWLCGAGPGDPGLLTLHAVHALRSADVIVYDALVSDAIMSFAGQGASREFAGKRGGKLSPKQGDITGRLVELARDGRRVLRLKGGDPFVFGRGGEEALDLALAGVPFRIIPGITAGLGGLAYAAIPATTRDTNDAVILATGHLAKGEVRRDWTAMARTGLPIILYMGMTHLESITAGLIAGGMAPETPVAIVANATTPAQRVLETTLATARADADRNGFASPSIIAVGSIVALRRHLAAGLIEAWR